MAKEYEAVKDSGERSSFSTGAVRDKRAGKGRYDLLPFRAMRRIAKHFENGAVKYGDHNWRRGIPLHCYIDSALRHIFCVLERKTDEDHAAAAAWNMLAYIETAERIEDGELPAALDDLWRVQAQEQTTVVPKGTLSLWPANEVEQRVREGWIMLNAACDDQPGEVLMEYVGAADQAAAFTQDGQRGWPAGK